jgi:hypothetical protein
MTPWRAALAVLVLLLVTLPLLAFVPSAERIEQAIAATNVASGRDKALRLELSLKIGDRVGVATAELISHPTGLARLELQGAGDLVERHLLQGSELIVGRNGEILSEHRAFLPPFFFLQAESPTTLRAALTSFDVLVDIVGFAQCGEEDCYVLGDPMREISRAALPEVAGLDLAYGDGYGNEQGNSNLDEAPAPGSEGSRSIDGLGAGPADVPSDEELLATVGSANIADTAGEAVEFQADVWPKVYVEAESYQIKGFETASGVRMLFGPIAAFGRLRVPSWIEIEEPDRELAHFDVIRANQVAAPLSIFEREWIESPASWDGVVTPAQTPTSTPTSGPTDSPTP